MSIVSSLTRRSLVGAAALGLALAVAGCTGTAPASNGTVGPASSGSATARPASMTIKSLDASGDPIDLEVPYDPMRIAVLDMASLDILDAIGMGERVVGSSTTSLEYLQDYVADEDVANLGTIKEADLEAVMACEPDIIFIGGRLSAAYDDLSEIAPVVFLSTDSGKGVVQSVRDNAATIASIFGREDEVDGLMADIDARIEALRSAAKGRTTLVTMFTSGGLNVLGDSGRCSLIGREVGFTNAAADEVATTHGNEISFETVVQKDPEHIFVLNRDAAIGADGTDQAKEIVENELTRQTRAYRNGRIVYLEHPSVWYTAEGGIRALDVMLQDLEGALL